jgi:hypothetical protein
VRQGKDLGNRGWGIGATPSEESDSDGVGTSPTKPTRGDRQGSDAIYTRQHSMKLSVCQVNFWISFEWGGKVLRMQALKDRRLKFSDGDGGAKAEDLEK